MGQCQSSISADQPEECSAAIAPATGSTRLTVSERQRQLQSSKAQTIQHVVPQYEDKRDSGCTSSIIAVKEEQSAETTETTTTTTSISDELSPSAHRRHTLDYQSKRRLELEERAASRLSALGNRADVRVVKTTSRPALRMPSKRDSSPGRREMLQRESSWFTLSIASSSDMSLDLMDQDFQDDTTMNNEQDDNSMLRDNSSWSAMDITTESSRRLLAPGLEYARCA